MHLQHGLFKGDEPANDKARASTWAKSVLKAEIDLHSITGKRRAARRLERCLAACCSSGLLSQGQAVTILLQVAS